MAFFFRKEEERADHLTKGRKREREQERVTPFCIFTRPTGLLVHKTSQSLFSFPITSPFLSLIIFYTNTTTLYTIPHPSNDICSK